MTKTILKVATALVALTNATAVDRAGRKERQFRNELRRDRGVTSLPSAPSQVPSLLPLLPGDQPDFAIVYPEG